MAPTAARRLTLTAALALLAPAPGWSQEIDLEAAGLLLVPTSTPGLFDVTPLLAGSVAPSFQTVQVEYRVYVNGQPIPLFPKSELRYPQAGRCVPADPPCLGPCMVRILSPGLPAVDVAGVCNASTGDCWCTFPPTALKPVRTSVLRCDVVTVVLDPLDKIAELDEGNNAVSVPGGICPCEDQGQGHASRAKAIAPSRPRSGPKNIRSELQRRPQPIRPPEPLVYDWAKKKVARNAVPLKRFAASFCYVNTDTSGFFTTTTLGTEFIDWGIMGGTATTKCCELSDIVSSFRFAYATTSLDTSVAGPGAALTLAFYTDFHGFGEDSGNCPVATFAFSGMPGASGSSSASASYAFTVELAGGFEFCLPDGRFGYGYRGDGNTGPLLCYAGDGAGGPEPCTGNEDVFDIWQPDTKGVNLGSFFFGGPPLNFMSWYGQIARAERSTPASVAFRNAAPNKAGSLVCSPAVLGGTLDLTVLTPGKAAAALFAFDTPITLVLGGGQVLLCLDLGSGELLTGGGLAALPTGNTVGGCPELSASAAVSKNLTLCGLVFHVQGILFGPPPFALSSACDMTLGS